MTKESESIFITGSQIPDTNEDTTKSILGIIKATNTFQGFVSKLKEDKLIWYFLRHLLEDQKIQDSINSKWKKEFADFNKSIDSAAQQLKESMNGQKFLAYPTSDNNLEIILIGDGSKQNSVETSSVLRASPEGKTINISLGADSIITATRKINDKRNERHYDFSNSDFCNMIISWEAKDDQGNVIYCSMTLRVGPNGVEEVIDRPLMKFIKQNTEVFINGKNLYEALPSIDQNVNNQQEISETILPISAKKNISRPNSSLSVDMSDPGVLTPSSNEYKSDDFAYKKVEELEQDNEELEQENTQLRKNNEELEQENTQLRKNNEELEQENTQLKKDNKELKERNERIIEEGEDYRLQLEKSEEQGKLLENKLAKNEDELRKVREENKADVTAFGDAIGKLEEDLKERDKTIRKLEHEITKLKGEINRINKANEELQHKLDKSEQEKGFLKTENEKLREEKQTLTDLVISQSEELAKSQSALQQPNEELQRQLNDLQDENKRLVDDLEQERKKNQQPNVNVFDEMSGDGKDEEINELKKQVEEKDKKILMMDTELEQAQEKIKNIENQSEQKVQELSKELRLAKEELEEIRDELNKNDELIDQLREGTVSKKLFAKLQSERDWLKHDSTVKEKQLDAINTQLEQTQKEVESAKETLKTLQDQLQQEEGEKTTTDKEPQNEVGTETALPEDNKDMQTTIAQKNSITKKLRQENIGLIRDKQTILRQLNQKIEENSELKKEIAKNSGLKQSFEKLQEENEQLKQRPAKVDASSVTDKKETREIGTQTDGEVQDLYDKDGTYLKTEFLPPKTRLSDPSTDQHSPSDDSPKLP